MSHVSPTVLPWASSQDLSITGHDLLSVENAVVVKDPTSCQGNNTPLPVPGVIFSPLLPYRVTDTAIKMSLTVAEPDDLHLCMRFAGSPFSVQGPTLTVQGLACPFSSSSSSSHYFFLQQQKQEKGEGKK